MRIKKTFQGNLPENTVVNAQSNSQTNAYSCNYSNEHYKGITLWTNPNPTLDLGDLTINFNDTYSKYVIEYVADSSSVGSSVKYYKEVFVNANSINFKLESMYAGYFRLRDCTALNNLVYFGPAYYYTAVGGTPAPSNIQCIPQKIIGYK